jgi:hypothetical protein
MSDLADDISKFQMDRDELTGTPVATGNSRKRMADEELRNNQSEQTPVNRRLRLGSTADSEEGKENEGDEESRRSECEEMEGDDDDASAGTVNLMEGE